MDTPTTTPQPGFIHNFMAKPHAKTRLIIVAAILLVVLGALYWVLNNRYISTDDAYVNANVVQVAAQVEGEVGKLYVDNNSYVKKGQPLLDLDSRPFKLAIKKAKAQLVMKQANALDAQLDQQRISTLVEEKALAQAALDKENARLESDNADVDLAKSELAQAKLNYSYAHLVAPSDGWVTNFNLRVGDAVILNQALFAFVDANQYWIDANYLENQLHQIKEGQHATISVDMYPDISFKGVVGSISHGAGNAFSLLPPQNATGNWVKITQRVPVRVWIINPDPQYPLRIGTSAEVSIDTQS